MTALVGNMLGDKWQIGANLESDDGSLSNMDMSVNLSRKFLDDRLTFNTNLGMRTDHATAADNSFIGDFDLEYQLSSLWTLKAYSHMNNQFYRQAPTTQGVGIEYSKEAATLKRLFQSFKPRRRRVQQQQTENGAAQTPLPSDSTQVKVEQQPIINEQKKKQ